ncbi:hypothetical protein L6164_006680 [Bauhinia variegata]|uniref:Uncharacterized protein n=2 Tax=Bauhinia variegata TaxID=167791 RepID=A0ACB9PXA3_BAUVA|nr:hypothetical protein L6164_006680 [Bauhinia variegata]
MKVNLPLPRKTKTEIILQSQYFPFADTTLSERTVSLAASMSNSPKIRSSCLLFLLLQHLFSVGVNSFEYDAVENLAINCGSSGQSIGGLNDSRIWIGDKDSNDQFSLIEDGKDSVDGNTTQFDSSVPQVPYYTARFSRSEFNYSFKVTEGPKFIRLHFFPFSSGNFDRSNSLFSVYAGRFTLLNDFNASHTADNDDDPLYFVSREYCINVDHGQRLTIAFVPSHAHPDFYAFINGIEVVSMPTNLYYPKPGTQGIKLVGYDNRFVMESNMALQTMYRINAGGSQIPSNRDTGMYRYWDGDYSYLVKAYNISVPVNYWPKNFTLIPNYTAPFELYLTARSYGRDSTSKYNVTWNFKVDPLFIYMVRLHFCEIELNITEGNEKVFQIFIDDMMAEDRADVVMWTKHNLVPIYKDYIVKIAGSLKQLNLSIKLQPIRTMFADDVILNGLEIFKVSDIGTGNLAGPNPEQRLSPPQSLVPPAKPPKSSKGKTIVATVAGAGSGLIVISFICFLIYRRTTRGSADKRSSKWRPTSLVPSKSSKSHGTSLPSDLCRYFSFAEITAATNNFNDVFVIGVGGFGKVYKGYIDDGTTPVAIKRLKPGSQQGAHEFETEIAMLSQLRHLHLVSLIGYCNDANEMILVYDFMVRGTLREHLYDSDNQLLSWKRRLEICLGAARGLHYLHTGAKHNIIHRDVKTTNILLDEKWVAKVSDFGLSKVGPTGMSKSHISTVVKGSFGYVDPAYYKRQHLTLKSDVYSFGVVLLEVLCARPPILHAVEKQQANLAEWVRKCHTNGEIDRTVDPFLRGTITPQCLNSYVDMALKCLLEDGNQRPSMNDLVWGLEFTIQLQESMEDTVLDGSTEDEKKGEERALLTNIVSVDVESDVLFTSTDESSTMSQASKMTTTSSEEQTRVPEMVFSELLDPTAR